MVVGTWAAGIVGNVSSVAGWGGAGVAAEGAAAAITGVGIGVAVGGGVNGASGRVGSWAVGLDVATGMSLGTGASPSVVWGATGCARGSVRSGVSEGSGGNDT